MAKVAAPKTREQKIDDVAGWERATYTLGGVAQRYNPDLLAGRQGLKIYAKMRLDAQVKAVCKFKRAAMQGRGWSLSYEDGSSLNEEERATRIQVMTRLLNNTKGTFEDALNKIQTAREYGFSLTEKVLTEVEIEGRLYKGLSRMLLRDQCTFRFYTDDYGILLRVAQYANGREQDIDISRFVYHVHNREFDEYFGLSDLREAYKPWYIKERITDYWALYLEKFAGGFLIIKQLPDSPLQLLPGTPLYTSLQNVLNNLHSATGIILPKGLEAELIHPPSDSQFETAINHQDKEIAKALLVPNLLGLSVSDGGASLGEGGKSDVQLKAFGWTINEEANAFASTIQEQVINPLGDLNWNDKEYPCFKFDPPDAEQLRWIIDTWIKLTGASVVINTEGDEAYLRNLLGMPKREPDAEPLVDPVEQARLELDQQAQKAAGDGQAFDQQMRTRQQREAERSARVAEKKPARKFTASDNPVEVIAEMLREQGHEVKEEVVAQWTAFLNQKVRPQVDVAAPSRRGEPTDGRPAAVPHGELRGCTMEQFSVASQRVSFSVIEQRQNAEEGRVVDSLASQVARATMRLIGNNDVLATLTDSNSSDVAAVEMSSSEKARLNAITRQGLRNAWDLGLTLARTEIDRARGERRRVFTDLRDRAAAFFEARAFRMAGDLSDQVRNVIQQELMQSVKSGRSPTQTREAIWGRLVDKGFTTKTYVLQNETDEDVQRGLDRLWADTEEEATAYLNTLARTNLFEAMNEARFAEFTDPALGDFVQAMAYSAVLDDRTTEICRELDGDTWSADSDMWNKYRPPNHFNCRGVLVPITRADGWDGEESDPPDAEPAPGFGRGEK